MAKHNETGRQGEALALDFILEKGYTLLEKNWRHLKSEIDLIAIDKDELVIIEVKTRSTAYFGEPEAAVDLRKQRQLIEGAAAYIEDNEIDMSCRYDIISIIMDGNTPAEIKHIKEAFYPQWG